MARISRKELKSDKFALEIGQTVTFVEEHRKELVRYGSIALAAAALIAGFVVYERREAATRQVALNKAIQVQETPVATVNASGGPTFPTQEAKDQAAIKTFGDLQKKYPGTTEGEIATYYLGAITADQGNLAGAEKYFLEVSEKGDSNYASLAKLSLGQIYFSDGRTAQGEKILRDLIARPTVFVSADQATVALARDLAGNNPGEARKLLQPLLTRPGPVAQVANSVLTGLAPK